MGLGLTPEKCFGEHAWTVPKNGDLSIIPVLTVPGTVGNPAETLMREPSQISRSKFALGTSDEFPISSETVSALSRVYDPDK